MGVGGEGGGGVCSIRLLSKATLIKNTLQKSKCTGVIDYKHIQIKC